MSEGWQYKMLNYEVTPPANVWDKIAIALDESNPGNEFPGTLYDLEVAPPAAAWDKIATSLDAEHEASVPERRRLSPLLRYAAAAAIIGLVAFGAAKLFTGKKEEQETAKITTPVKNAIISGTKASIAQAGNDRVTTDEAREDAALEESKHTFAKLDMPVTNRVNRTNNYFAEPVDLTNTNREINPEETYRELCAETAQSSITSGETGGNTASRYIMLMTPDGNIIRMSKKWGSLLCCVSGEEQDEDCKDQLKKWREKIASSPVQVSPGNFMDILSLVNSLQDNNH